jgi:DNA polymerase III delta prime subunit
MKDSIKLVENPVVNSNEKLIEKIKNNRIILTTNLRNDDGSPLSIRLATIRETKELIKIALNLGIESPEINCTLRILGIDTIDT